MKQYYNLKAILQCNYNLTILDVKEVHIGNDVMMGPDCMFLHQIINLKV